MNQPISRWLAITLSAVLSACAALPPEIPDSPALTECRARYLELDGAARDAGVHIIPGFPYLRSNRFLASFRNEVKDGAPFKAWVERLRQLDLEAREVELRNLGEPAALTVWQQLQRCGKEWAAHDLADAARRALLRERAAVPDDYSLTRRVLGFYPVAVPFLKIGINGYQDEVREDYALPLNALDTPGPLMLWKPDASTTVAPKQLARWLAAEKDALGIPELSDAQWRQLAASHAPSWWIETGGDFDRPGAPVLRDGEPALNLYRPVTYFMPSYTRFGGKVLAQLVYVVWFSERPRDGLVDSYSGALDGLVWRVTLDTDGRPLLYDTIHPCGCYHYFFNAKPLKLKPQDRFWQEPVLFPQQPAPAQPFAVRIQSRTHFVRRLAPLKQARGETRQYSLAPYRDLLTLPIGAGATRSLFSDDGIVWGTERFERFWLWPTGVVSPGAMRQAGRQATAFVGRRHFDDADLLDKLFVAP